MFWQLLLQLNLILLKHYKQLVFCCNMQTYKLIVFTSSIFALQQIPTNIEIGTITSIWSIVNRGTVPEMHIAHINKILIIFKYNKIGGSKPQSRLKSDAHAQIDLKKT